MPRAKADETKSNDGTKMVMVTLVGQPADENGERKTTPVDYTIPSDATKFQEFILSLSGDTLTEAYEDYVDGVRSRVRADAYEAAQSESTWITVGKDGKGNAIRKDLLTFPVDKFAAAYNFQWSGLSAKATMLDKSVDELDRGFGAWRAAAKKHADAGRVKMATDGTVAVV